MDIIKRRISPQVLLSEKQNPVLPTLSPKPLISAGINTFDIYPDCVGYDYDVCVASIPGNTIFGMQEMVLELYREYVENVFYDNFSEGTSWWEAGSNQGPPNEMIVNFIFNNSLSYMQSPNNPLVMVEVEDSGSGGGQVFLSSIKKVWLNADTNYRINTRLSGSIVQQSGGFDASFLMIYAYDQVSNTVVSNWFSNLDLAAFPQRDNLSMVFTPPVTGDYEFGIYMYPTSWNNGDFILVDDFSITIEESPSNLYTTVEGILKKTIEFFKGFNIEPSETNITYYRDIIGKYLTSNSLPFEQLPVGYYGTQSLDDTGNQTGGYIVTSPPQGVVPFYYLSYNLYGTITDSMGEIIVNDGYLYCNGQDLGPWDGMGPDYFTGDLVQDTNGNLWYCNQDSSSSCNDCAPEDDCAWIPCLNVMGHQKGELNLNIPLYQDIKDIGFTRDLVLPAIAPECSGDTRTLTQDYTCPVPYYTSDGGEVIFFNPLTLKEVLPDRKCCEDYDQYGFVWWNGKCYRDYGNSLAGQGEELFNYQYDMFFIDWADNNYPYVYAQTPTTVMIEGGTTAEIFGGSGKRVLFHTPLIKNLIKDQKYVVKSKIQVDFYSNNTISNFLWWATGDQDPNWGVLYYDSYDLGWTVPNGVYLGSMLPGVADCSTAIVEQGVSGGQYIQHTTNCDSGKFTLDIYLDQGKQYRVRFRYIDLDIGDQLTNANGTTTIGMALGPNDIDFMISEGFGASNMIYQMFINNQTGDIITPTIVPANSGNHSFEFQYRNPNNASTCGPPGNACIGDAGVVYGFAFEYFLVEEIPYGLTDDVKVKVTPTKVWSSDISPTGPEFIEIESEITSLINPWCEDSTCDNEYDCEGNQAGQCASIWHGNEVSLRLICDVKEPIQSPPLQFRLNIEEISFKYYQKPNFLGCSKTQFLSQVAVQLPPDSSPYPMYTNPNTGIVDPTIGVYSNTLDVQPSSAPYVNTIESTSSLLNPAVSNPLSADCDTDESPIIGWVCDLYYVVPYPNQSPSSYAYAGCIAVTADQYNNGWPGVPGGTAVLYSTADECILSSNCTEHLGCTDPNAINYDPNANQPCATQNPVSPSWPNTTGVIDDCCIFPTEGCTIMSATNWDPLATIENGTCSFLGGCPDPTADNYFCAATNCCTVTAGIWGNVASCTDCNGNPPSEAFGLMDDNGNLWYPNAIQPGTLGNNSCCDFDSAFDDPVGCTDPLANNYDGSAIVPCVINMVPNACCTYGLNEDVYCCFATNAPIPCTGVFNINNIIDYNAWLAQPGCYDEEIDCATNTPCYLN